MLVWQGLHRINDSSRSEESESISVRVGAKFYQLNRFRRTDRKVSPGHRSKIRERSKSVLYKPKDLTQIERKGM